MRIYLASGNAHKVEEFRQLASDTGFAVEVFSAREIGGMPPVQEDAGTFAGNARKKARALLPQVPPGAWVLADDSGLCVDALDGAPGVESAYYAGPLGDSRANLAKLVETMQAVPEARRGAHFTCVLCLVASDGREQVFEGICPGRLRREPRGGGGFGYDPLFVPDEEEKTFAELGEAVKNRLSHRARAWQRLAAWVRGN
ncbi:MAG: RdgB/HAM1 family non-canonical purine NTP pyrophosphatase [Verrucomicrobia bacterium]|nr:RdgB/HAM1 family non-canonical purine NTP pyrophosphatase [Verrucomicrobiota bacterium]